MSGRTNRQEKECMQQTEDVTVRTQNVMDTVAMNHKVRMVKFPYFALQVVFH
jgi:hypothetical protein